jgi:hypothetical protein|tara:strand:- start:80 stop:331 length:252 start_codon:yes stop_codon:yes gene_type:complete
MARKNRKGGLTTTGSKSLTKDTRVYKIVAINSLTDKPSGVKESVIGLNEAKRIADLMAQEKNRKCYVLDNSNRSVYRTEIKED